MKHLKWEKTQFPDRFLPMQAPIFVRCVESQKYQRLKRSNAAGEARWLVWPAAGVANRQFKK